MDGWMMALAWINGGNEELSIEIEMDRGMSAWVGGWMVGEMKKRKY